MKVTELETCVSKKFKNGYNLSSTQHSNGYCYRFNPNVSGPTMLAKYGIIYLTTYPGLIDISYMEYEFKKSMQYRFNCQVVHKSWDS